MTGNAWEAGTPTGTAAKRGSQEVQGPGESQGRGGSPTGPAPDVVLQGALAMQAAKKRRRGAGPRERCPYCRHSYTVRDGLSAKLGPDGQRLHQRKCQCRSKTPPCR